MRRPGRLLLVARGSLLALLACGQGIPLAENLQLSPRARQIDFAQPLTTTGPRALRFEFERPRDRTWAPGIQVVLLRADGSGDTLRPQVDQVGEAAVCLRESSDQAATYTGLRLRSPRPLRVKRLEWAAPIRKQQVKKAPR